MAYYMRLQNLPIEATSKDIRHFFKDHTIPKGGIHIVGGVDEEAFINFSDELDLLRALELDNQPLLGQPVRLLLEKKDEEEHNQFKELLQIGKPAPHDPVQQSPSHQQHHYYPEEGDIEPEAHYEPPPLFGQPVKFSLGKKEEPKSPATTVSEEPTASQWFKRQLGISAEDSSSESEEEPQTTDNKTLSASDIASLMSGYQKSNVSGGQSYGRQDSSTRKGKMKRVSVVRGSSEESDSDRKKVKRSRWVYDKDIRKVEVKKAEKSHASHKGRWDASSCTDDSDSEETKHVICKAPPRKSRWETYEASQGRKTRKVKVKKDGSLSVIRAAYSESSSEDERSRSRRDRHERSRRGSHERERDRRDSKERHRSSRSRRSRERDRSRHRRRSRSRSSSHNSGHSRERERSRENSPHRRSGRRKEERKKMDNIPEPREYEKRETEKKEALHAAAHVIVSNLDCTATSKAIREFFSGFEIPEGGITLRVTKGDPNNVKAGVIFPLRSEAMKAEKMIGKLNGREIQIKFLTRRLFSEELKGMREIVEEHLDPARYSKIEGPPNVINELPTCLPPSVSIPQQNKKIEDLPTYVPPPVSIPELYKGIEDKGLNSLYGTAEGGIDTSVPPPPLPGQPGALPVTPKGPPGMAMMGPGMRPPGPMVPGYGPLVLYGPRGHPGPGPPRPMPPGFRPPGSVPPGTMPLGPMPPWSMPPGFRPPRMGPPGPMPPGMGPPGPMPPGMGPPGPMPPGMGPPGPMPPGMGPPGPMPPGMGPPGPMPPGMGPPGMRPPGMGPPGPMRPGFHPPRFGPPGPWPPYGPPRPGGPRGPPPPPGLRGPLALHTRPALKVINTSTPQVSIAKKPALELLGPNADPISIQVLGANQGHIRIQDLDGGIKASELWQKLMGKGNKPESVTLVQDSDGKAVFAFVAFKRTVNILKYMISDLKDMKCTLVSQKARNTELTEVSPSHKISVAIDSTDDHFASEENLNALKLNPETEHLSQGVDHDTAGANDDVTPTKILDGSLIEDPKKTIKLNLRQQRKAEKYQEELRLMCMDVNAVKEELDRETKIKAEQDKDDLGGFASTELSGDGAISMEEMWLKEEEDSATANAAPVNKGKTCAEVMADVSAPDVTPLNKKETNVKEEAE